MSPHSPKTPFDDLTSDTPTPAAPISPSPSPKSTRRLDDGSKTAPTRIVAATQQPQALHSTDDSGPDTQVPLTQHSRRGLLPNVLPTPTLVGLSMAVGAICVLAISVFLMRAVPVAESKSPSPAVNEPRVVQAPARSSQPLPGGDAPFKKPQTNADIDTPDAQAEVDFSAREADEEPNRSTTTPTEVDEESSSTRIDENARSETRNSRPRSDQYAERISDKKRDARSDTSRSSDTGSKYLHPRSRYSIQPPDGFDLQKTGARTLWRGPAGARILVETSNSPGRSPRADWEKLDKALAKKYGKRYRSFGIRNTTLAGRAAAVWEFEIGNTRKIDIAVHHKGNGYAILAEAPSARFESLRPQFEATFDSFELPVTESTRSPENAETPDRKNGSTGY